MAWSKSEHHQWLKTLKANQMLVMVNGTIAVPTYRKSEAIRTLDAIAPALNLRRQVFSRLKSRVDNTLRVSSMSYPFGLELDKNGRIVVVTLTASAQHFKQSQDWRAVLAAESVRRHSEGVKKGYKVVKNRRDERGRFARDTLVDTIVRDEQ